jgi:hypothetical protein
MSEIVPVKPSVALGPEANCDKLSEEMPWPEVGHMYTI